MSMMGFFTGVPGHLGRALRLAVGGTCVAVFALAVGSGVASASGGFGVSSFTMGTSSSQAGGHVDFTTSFGFGREALGGPAGQVKNVTVVLPEGLVGDPQDIPQCTTGELVEFDCQPSAQVGVLTTKFSFPAKEVGEEPVEFEEQTGVYNMVPNPGHPATFATSLAFATVLIQADVARDGTYRLVASVREISTLEPVVSTSLTMWGVPADSSHDGLRFGPPPNYGIPTRAGAAPAPFMINSSDCSDGPLASSLTVDSWEGETATASTSMRAPTGCGLLEAAPTLSVQPDTAQAGAPAGYDVNLTVPQELAPYALSTPDLRDANVTFPAGTVVSPSSANGLQACSLEQIGLNTGAPVGCPDASKIGTVEVLTPLLGAPLKGSLYVAAQGANPFKSLLAVYLVAEGSSVQVKLAGRVSANPANGQLTTSFTGNPKVPFSELRVHLFGGQGASLSNPTTCGEALSTSQLTFYSSPVALTPSSAFNVTGCTGPQFAPSFTAGTVDPRSGGFSPLSVAISRTDSDQYLSGVQVTTPQGLLGILKGIPLCPEPQASKGDCSSASQIGHVVSSAGPGPSPVFLPGTGQPQDPVFLTGGYNGAPFGLSILVPAIAGPFNLGNVVVRAAVSVDPATAQVAIGSDPLPQILQGIPLQVRSVNVVVDRPGFTFNPTGCEPRSVTGVLTSIQGAKTAVSSPFQTANCRALAFKPVFTASTQANDKTKGKGASLTVHVSTHQGPTGSGAREANIAKVNVQLPISLPSRLTTLQKACTEQQFAKDPRGCPPEAMVGTAIAHTPVLPVPLEGPAILVSHAGAGFPDLDLVLQGYGVTVVLTGHTQITKGITFSHFETVPDAPISSFELKLPQGPHSILAAFLTKGTLCEPLTTRTVTKTVTVKVNGEARRVKRAVKETVAGALLMPTTITAQNGAILKQNTRIAVRGCPGAKAARNARKARRARRARTVHSNRKAARR
jgi:hypothetical protein